MGEGSGVLSHRSGRSVPPRTPSAGARGAEEVPVRIGSTAPVVAARGLSWATEVLSWTVLPRRLGGRGGRTPGRAKDLRIKTWTTAFVKGGSRES